MAHKANEENTGLNRGSEARTKKPREKVFQAGFVQVGSTTGVAHADLPDSAWGDFNHATGRREAS